MKEVTAALLVKNDLILIAKRKASDKLANKWEFPGGKIEEGESPEECLKREMKEEFGIDISVGNFFDKSEYHYDHGSIILLAYWSYWDSGELIPKVHDEYKWVSVEELVDYDFAPADKPFVQKLIKRKI